MQGDGQNPFRKRRVMVAALGACVHNMGVENFADWMVDKNMGYVAVKLGPAVAIEECVNKIREARPEVVGVSIRLGDLHVDQLIGQFIEQCWRYGVDPHRSHIRYAFGGLRPAANLVRAMTGLPILEDRFGSKENQNYDLTKVAAQFRRDERYRNFFELIVDDAVDMETLERFAEGKSLQQAVRHPWSDFLVERIAQVRERENRPALRAHIGIAAGTIEPTVNEVRELAEAEALEIVSLAQDQPAQELLVKFIRGEEDPERHLKGQGGCPIRSIDDLQRLKAATQTGNFPTTRIYSGTDDFIDLAKLWEEHLNIAFPAVPLYYYSKLDGRGPVSIRDAFDEHMDVIRWWGQVGKPVEINDPHQWSLRNASDVQCVVDHVICGIVAQQCGVGHYVQQMMFDLPPGMSAKMDLAKFKAAYELIEPLTRRFDFQIIKETRGGLNSFPPNLFEAKGHLAYTTRVQMYMEPDIVHVVSFPEAHHEARAADIIESCDIVKYVIRNVRQEDDQSYIWLDPKLAERITYLKRATMYTVLHLALMAGYEGRVTLRNFHQWARTPDEAAQAGRADENYAEMLFEFLNPDRYPSGSVALISSDNLDMSLQTGLCQAPQVTVPDRRYEMAGACRTRVIDGACHTVEFSGQPVADEMKRVDMVREKFPWFFDKTISRTNEASTIRIDKDEIVRAEQVQAFREQIGLGYGHAVRDDVLAGKKVLVVDFGSTFTKVGTFHAGRDDFQLSYVPTTPDDLRKGLAHALGVYEACERSGGWRPLEQAMERFDIRLPCSSAKGGLKVVTVSVVADESGKAADLAALSAGGKLLASYAGMLTAEQVAEIYLDKRPEIILLAGGVDFGGDTDTVIHNASMLAEGIRFASYARYGVPIIYAGTRDARAEVQRIFRRAGIDCRISENVMPEINRFHIEAVNEAIRELFSTIIIRGKGFDVVEPYFHAPFIPTPKACMLGVNLLADGFGDEVGMGNLLALDVGGCTTDFYGHLDKNRLFSHDWPDARRRNKRVILRTPNDPLVFRRVEGKYGMSYNAENLMELADFRDGSMGERIISALRERYPTFLPHDLMQRTDGQRSAPGSFLACWQRQGQRWTFDLGTYLNWLSAHPESLPATSVETTMRALVCREILRVATHNNVGRVEETETYFLQNGVNFTNADCRIVLIGGTIYHKFKEGSAQHMADLVQIAAGARFDDVDPLILRPRGDVLADADYIVSIVGGLYGRLDPEGALRMMKSRLRRLPLLWRESSAAAAPQAVSASG